MTKADQIRAFVTKNPGLKASQIAKGLGLSTKDASSFLNFMSLKAATRTLVRKEVERTITNQPVYGYWAKGDDNYSLEKIEPLPKGKLSKHVSGLDTLVDELAANIAKQLANKVKRRLTVELENLLPSPVMDEPDLQPLLDKLALPAPVKEIKVSKPRVGVVGLMPVQAGELSQEFGEVLDLRFAADNVDEMKSLKNCDVIFLHTRHMKHSHDQYVRTFGVKVIRVTGGVSKLRDELTAFYANT